MVNYAGPHLVWAKGKGLCCLRLAGVCGHWMPLFPQTYNSKTTQKKITTAEKAGRHHAESLPIRETAREHWVFPRNLGMAKDGRKSLFLTVSRSPTVSYFVLVLLLPKPHLLLRQGRYKQLFHGQHFSVAPRDGQTLPSQRGTIWACLHEQLHLTTSVHWIAVILQAWTRFPQCTQTRG